LGIDYQKTANYGKIMSMNSKRPQFDFGFIFFCTIHVLKKMSDVESKSRLSYSFDTHILGVWICLLPSFYRPLDFNFSDLRTLRIEYQGVLLCLSLSFLYGRKTFCCFLSDGQYYLKTLSKPPLHVNDESLHHLQICSIFAVRVVVLKGLTNPSHDMYVATCLLRTP